MVSVDTSSLPHSFVPSSKPLKFYSLERRWDALCLHASLLSWDRLLSLLFAFWITLSVQNGNGIFSHFLLEAFLNIWCQIEAFFSNTKVRGWFSNHMANDIVNVKVSLLKVLFLLRGHCRRFMGAAASTRETLVCPQHSKSEVWNLEDQKEAVWPNWISNS